MVGPTRTPTLDPLIKSQLAHFDKARLFSRLQRKVLLLDQYVTSNFPTFDVSTVVNIYSTSILMLQTRCQDGGARRDEPSDLMQFDDNHLSVAGSKFFVRSIAKQILD